jgi:hypothetical protein
MLEESRPSNLDEVLTLFKEPLPIIAIYKEITILPSWLDGGNPSINFTNLSLFLKVQKPGEAAIWLDSKQ